jgi:hypothetical protein
MQIPDKSSFRFPTAWVCEYPYLEKKERKKRREKAPTASPREKLPDFSSPMMPWRS